MIFQLNETKKPFAEELIEMLDDFLVGYPNDTVRRCAVCVSV